MLTIGTRIKHGGRLGVVQSVFITDGRLYVTALMDSGQTVTDSGYTFTQLFFDHAHAEGNKP